MADVRKDLAQQQGAHDRWPYAAASPSLPLLLLSLDLPFPRSWVRVFAVFVTERAKGDIPKAAKNQRGYKQV
jgi:hypothetical protein